jgi:uncharacterized phage-associated protein
MPFTADAIANFFLDHAEGSHRALTQIQVQKLVFYSHGWYLALDDDGRPLIGEPIEVWKFGPVFRSLYREFRDFGNQPIKGRAKEFKLDRTDGKLNFSVYEPSVEEENPPDVDKSLAKAVLDRVWQVYGSLTAYQLSNMTHAEGEPWRIIRDALPAELPKGMHLPNATIRECFRQRLQPLVT